LPDKQITSLSCQELTVMNALRNHKLWLLFGLALLVAGCDAMKPQITLTVVDFLDKSTKTYSGATVEQVLSRVDLGNPVPNKDNPLKGITPFTKYEVRCTQPKFQQGTYSSFQVVRDSETSPWKIDPEYAARMWPELPHQKK
jgi:hypothetical protein